MLFQKWIGLIIIGYSFYVFSIPHISQANDMPMAGIIANGIVVKDENNIQIEKETLYISNSLIEVSYEFKNLSTADITTEVAFPIPQHRYDPTGHITHPVHGDFKLIVNGKAVKCALHARALFKDKDYTSLLASMNVSIVDFGNNNKFFERLNKDNQKTLLDIGLVTNDPAEGVMPQWSVDATYYWKQPFPANKTVNIKHSYRPNTYSATHYFKAGRSFEAAEEIESLAKEYCLSKDIKKWMGNTWGGFRYEQVSYILTTANHWKKPIKEFHIIIEPAKYSDFKVSTCFEFGKLKRVGKTRYVGTFKDYIPDKEVEVHFLQ